MIERALRNCIIARMAIRLKKWYACSAVCRLLAVIGSAYNNSLLAAAVRRVFGSPVHSRYSKLNKRLSRFNEFLRRRGHRFLPNRSDSFTLRLVDAAGGTPTIQYSKTCWFFGGLGARGVLLAIFSLYLPIDALLRAIGSLETIANIWDEAFFLLCLLYILFELLFTRDRIAPRVTPLDAMLLVFLAIGLMLMCFVSPDFSVAFAGYRAVCQYMLWFFIVVRLVRTDGNALLPLVILAAIGTFVALHGIYQFIIAAPIPDAWTSDTEMGVRTRVYSIFGSPNVMGSFMVMTAPILIAFAYKAKKIVSSVFLFGCAGIACLACLFTFSRGAWMGMAVALLVFALLRDRRLLAVFAVVMIIALSIPDIANRIAYLFTSDFADASQRAGRTGRWAFGMDLLLKNGPWFGFGLGRFGGAVAMQNQVMEGVKYFYMDNYYLKTLVEMGYVGFAGYISLIVAVVWNGLRSLFRVKNTDAYELCAGIFAAISGVLVHCLFENIFEVPYMNAYFWGLVALLMWFGFIRGNSARAK